MNGLVATYAELHMSRCAAGSPDRAILWDFDGTLAERPGMWGGCMVEVLDEHEPGHRIQPGGFRQSLADGFPWHTPDIAHGHLSDSEAWWEHVEPLLARGYEGAGFSAGRATELARLARQQYVAAVHWKLFSDTTEVLTDLRGAGWRHVILSNHVPELPALVSSLGLDDLIDAVVNSAVTGYEKPHPEAFALGRRAAGDPSELWMIGDNPVADVAGAERAGIPAILVRRSDDIAPEVTRRARDLTAVVRWLAATP
jgi:putative hydrolase of the HAD superfamily